MYGVEYLDLSSVLDNQRESDYAPEGSHLSEEGYRKVAIYLFEKSRWEYKERKKENLLIHLYGFQFLKYSSNFYFP